MRMKAILLGTVKRVAKVNSPAKIEFTIETKEIRLNGNNLFLREKVTFRVDVFRLEEKKFADALINLSVGDSATVEAEKTANEWIVTDLTNVGDTGREAGEYLDDLLDENRFGKH